MTMYKDIAFWISICFILLLKPSNAHSEDYEIQLTGFDTFNLNCNTGNSDLDYVWNCLNYLYDKTDNWGFSRRSYPDDPWIIHWQDYDRDYEGIDHSTSYGVDTYDVAVMYTHGTAHCNEANDWGTMTAFRKKGSTDQCNVIYGIWVDNGVSLNGVQWGDLDLNLVIIDTCQSLQKCNIEHGSFFTQIAAGTLSIVNGFHGLSEDSYDHTYHFEDFVDGTRNDGFGHDWVHDMTDFEAGDDECAISVVYETLEADADDTYENTGFKNYYGPNTHNSLWWYYIDECHPSGGPEL